MSFFCKQSRFSGCILFAILALFAPNALVAQQDLTALRPPKGELAPGFWEQSGWMVAVGLIVLIGGALAWAMLRKGKKPPVLPPPVQIARRSLEALRTQESGEAWAVGVSKILKNYLVAVLQLPSGEYTTQDMNNALQAQSAVALDLKQKITKFLHYCDEQKFSGTRFQNNIDIIGTASELVEQMEIQFKNTLASTPVQPESAQAK